MWLGNYSIWQFIDPQNCNPPCTLSEECTITKFWTPTIYGCKTKVVNNTQTQTAVTPVWWTSTPTAVIYPSCDTTPDDSNDYTNDLGSCVCKPWYKPGTSPCKKCSDPGVCCGIQLNTSVPFIGNCIESETGNVGSNEEKWVSWDNAFPVLMGSLTKILVTVILIVSFVLIVVWGIMISTGNVAWWKGMIIKVAAGIAILWASGVILRLINPNFFG